MPADAIIIKTSDDDGICYVETSQLDGETNLKQFNALEYTNKLREEDLLNITGTIITQVPNRDLDSFQAKVTVDENSIGVERRNLILQGSRVRNTEFVIAVVVATGKHTKLSLNQRNVPSKVSPTETIMNRFIIAVMIAILLMTTIATVISWYYESDADALWYLKKTSGEEYNIGVDTVKKFFYYFVLLSYFIPMSMMVTFEIGKLAQGLLMQFDSDMAIKERITVEEARKDYEKKAKKSSKFHRRIKPFDENKQYKRVNRMMPKTTNLNDQLALVEYIFSDKTGTLTENVMKFKYCSINGVKFEQPMEGEIYSKLLEEEKTDTIGINTKYLKEFLNCLSICHTAVPEKQNGKLAFEAQSPDEIALLQAAQQNSYVFKSKTQKSYTVEIGGVDKDVQILCVAEFTSARKRMSIIVRDTSGTIKMYTKGADNVILSRLVNNKKNDDIKELTQKHLDDYATEGLRTLALAMKVIPEDTFNAWYERYSEASCSMEDRTGKVAALFEELEDDFTLLGCTAIEDCLQEGVPETIANLLKANIRIWVLTGDKKDTAINIGYSCKLLKKEMELFVIEGTTAEEVGEELTKGIKGTANRDASLSAMVCCGPSLEFALGEHLDKFLALGDRCSSVICCRVSPSQKAKVVLAVKHATHKQCLAIGDGANDVNMIQSADIGVGIFGREGTQAARAADYAIRRFKFFFLSFYLILFYFYLFLFIYYLYFICCLFQ